MSLSDYSSDDSFEAEDSQVSQKAVKGLQKAKMSAKGTRSSNAGFSTVRTVSGRRLGPICLSASAGSFNLGRQGHRLWLSCCL